MAYDMYQERILEHYRKPRNFGHLEGADAKGTEANPLCGDNITLEISLDPSRERVEKVSFSGEGCAISVASASLLTEEIKGKALKDLSQMTQSDVEKFVGVPLTPVRVKCALTSLTALNHALDTLRSLKKRPGEN